MAHQRRFVFTQLIANPASRPLVRRVKPEQDDDCPICMEKLIDDTYTEANMPRIEWLEPCRHCYHSSCIDALRQSGHYQCPFCRQEFIRGEGRFWPFETPAKKIKREKKQHRLMQALVAHQAASSAPRVITGAMRAQMLSDFTQRTLGY